ncbi:MAG: FAD-dependent oxidoreductase, partial [Spirochaetales bacterium]|nr:FAD-dependent oxidoreductase [Spirochaetales bacterium]
MTERRYDATVLGGGSAGLAAALEIAERGHRVAVLEREHELGGILNQCIHNGFGLHRFGDDLTGPEYAERFIQRAAEHPGVDIFLDTTALEAGLDGSPVIYGYSSRQGILELRSGAVVLAMGCRERNRGNIGIPGTRPAGVYTAGLAQRLINIDGIVPGRRAVVVGSGDIGLIMARRLSWVGTEVQAVVEI